MKIPRPTMMTTGKASSNYTSLCTVIPMSIVRQWNLKEGDKLDWSGKFVIMKCL